MNGIKRPCPDRDALRLGLMAVARAVQLDHRFGKQQAHGGHLDGYSTRCGQQPVRSHATHRTGQGLSGLCGFPRVRQACRVNPTAKPPDVGAIRQWVMRVVLLFND